MTDRRAIVYFMPATTMTTMNGTCGHLWKTAVNDLTKPTLRASDEWQRHLETTGRALLFLLAFVVFVLLTPLIAVATVIFLTYRLILTAMVFFEEGTGVSIVDGDDSMWLQDAAVNRAVINIMLMFKGQPDIAHIRQIFADRLVAAVDGNSNGKTLFPKLRQYTAQVYRRHVWKEEAQFDIADHVFLHQSPLPVDKLDQEKLIGDICSKPFPARLSAWQVVLIASDEAKAAADGGRHSFFILFRVHHSLADGISLIRMLMYNLVDVSPPRLQSGRFCARDRLWRSTMALLSGPLLLTERFMWRPDRNVLHGPPLSGDKRVSWSDPIELDVVKRIGKATGATVNDVLVCCLAGAFGEYFREHGSDAAGSADSIKAYVPVDIRPASFDTPTMTNQFALVLLDLPIGERNPLATLHATKRRMDVIKRSPEPIVNAMTITYGMNNLPNWLTQSVFDWLSSKCTMVLSNVPGPPTTMTIGGHEMEGVIFWPPQRSNIGIGVSIFSYNGYIRVGVLSDTSLLTEPQLVVAEFPKQVQQLIDCLKIE